MSKNYHVVEQGHVYQKAIKNEDPRRTKTLTDKELLLMLTNLSAFSRRIRRAIEREVDRRKFERMKKGKADE